jgi:methylated-DNA-[protein]-cysteine S-methyltransferase
MSTGTAHTKKGRRGMLAYKYITSPIGRLKLVAGGAGLIAVLWPNDRPLRIKLDEMQEDLHHSVLAEAEHQLAQYFKGERTTFDLPLQFQGTAFQKRVWQLLLRIPYGETRSYGQLALAMGNGSASRAVGLANSKNPLSIIVPCHRVIGASGKLTGFAGGLETKARLLDLEGAVPLLALKAANPSCNLSVSGKSRRVLHFASSGPGEVQCGYSNVEARHRHSRGTACSSRGLAAGTG